MAKEKKIKKEIHEELNLLLDALGRGQNQLGILELQKHEILHELAAVKAQLQDVQVKIKDEYGEVSIDVKTGVYTKKED